MHACEHIHVRACVHVHVWGVHGRSLALYAKRSHSLDTLSGKDTNLEVFITSIPLVGAVLYWHCSINGFLSGLGRWLNG